MPQKQFWNYCKWVAHAGGTGPFTVWSAYIADPAGSHDIPENCGVKDGNTYRYYAQNSDNSEWEWGRGVYTVSTHTLTRNVVSNSNDTTSPVNFTSWPIIDLIPAPVKSVELGQEFSPATSMIFYQAAAPAGWVKITTQNDKALRVVSGSGGVGTAGSVPFSTLFGRTQVDSHAIDLSELVSHRHSVTEDIAITSNLDVTMNIMGYTYTGTTTLSQYTTYVGGGAGHVHGLDMRLQYVDVIICQKSA